MNHTQAGRNVNIDIIKGICIFLMVEAHANGPFGHFIYLFHMAAFIMASGFCFKKHYSDNIKSVLVFMYRKLKTLWLPYVIWTAIYSFLHNVFLNCNILTDNPRIFECVNNEYAYIAEYWPISTMIKNSICGLVFWGGDRNGRCVLVYWSIS